MARACGTAHRGCHVDGPHTTCRHVTARALAQEHVHALGYDEAELKVLMKTKEDMLEDAMQRLEELEEVAAPRIAQVCREEFQQEDAAFLVTIVPLLRLMALREIKEFGAVQPGQKYDLLDKLGALGRRWAGQPCAVYAARAWANKLRESVAQ